MCRSSNEDVGAFLLQELLVLGRPLLGAAHDDCPAAVRLVGFGCHDHLLLDSPARHVQSRMVG